MPEKLVFLDEVAAELAGYRPLTYPIDATTEQWILENVAADMAKGKIPCCLVAQDKGIEIWRKPRCMI